MQEDGQDVVRAEKQNAHAGPKAAVDSDDLEPDEADGLPDINQIREELARQRELVPMIGTRWRWYDLPYRGLEWALTGWRARLVPWPIRSRLNNASNLLLAYDEHQRHKVERRDDPMSNLVIPTNESLAQGAIWVAEFFPPSYYPELIKSLRHNGWDQSMHAFAREGTNAEHVTRARRGRGFAWSLIGAVARPHSRRRVLGARRESLPAEFDTIELSAVQLGSSLTAVIAFIQLTEAGSTALDSTWRAPNEPTFELNGLDRPRVRDRLGAAVHSTQTERARLHDLARRWLRDRCGGYFASTPEGQPVIDFTMFEGYDPTSTPMSRDMFDPLRALAMTGNEIYNLVASSIEGAVLVPSDDVHPEVRSLRGSWGVVGARQAFVAAHRGSGHAHEPHDVPSLAALVNTPVRSFLMYVAVVQYARRLQEAISDARDTARQRHGVFSPRHVERLKRELLSTSLDLPAVARDTAMLWTPIGRSHSALTVHAEPAPGAVHERPGFDMIESLGQQRAMIFERLLEDDTAYRNVMATAASLGATAASARLARRALLVSATSLIVSSTALLLTHGDSVWQQLARMLP